MLAILLEGMQRLLMLLKLILMSVAHMALMLQLYFEHINMLQGLIQ